MNEQLRDNAALVRLALMKCNLILINASVPYSSMLPVINKVTDCSIKHHARVMEDYKI